tara:strand:- start:395 stop:883 length:489 start_codon:yes stop_codon:yes gene_type:complete
MKECTKCGQSKELTEYHKNKSNTDGLRGGCKPCLKLEKRAYVAKNREKVRAQQATYRAENKDKIDAHYKKNRTKYRMDAVGLRYDMTVEAYDIMFADQLGCCKMCDVEEKHAPRQRLCVDHDHDTGAIRGLLCGNCNSAIGLLKDSSVYTIRATTYLQDNGK